MRDKLTDLETCTEKPGISLFVVTEDVGILVPHVDSCVLSCAPETNALLKNKFHIR